MATWTQKQMLLTIAGVTVGVALAAGGGVYYAQGLIEELQGQIEAKNGEVAAADQKIAQIPGIEKEVIILRENLDEYVKILPDNRGLNDFVRALNQFERQSGIFGTALKQKKASSKQAGRFTTIEYTYAMTATLWETLKFMNLVENYERFVSITDFSLTAGGSDTRDREVVHTVTMTLRTYTYNGAGAGKEVLIPDYEDRKAELVEEIWKRMQAIRLDRYEHRGQQGRRDIFLDPRERGDDRLDGPSPAKQREVLDRYIGSIRQLNEMLQTMRREDTTLFDQYSLEKRLRTELGELLGTMETDASMMTFGPNRLRWAKEVVAAVDLLKAELDTGDVVKPRVADPYLPKADMQQLIADMAADCGNGLLEQARDRYEAVRDRLQVPGDDPRHELAVTARAWQVKAVTALDFKALDLRVQGVVVNRDGASGVLLNGETYQEGDYISDDLLVKLVEEEQVWFVFRGLTLVRTM